MASRVPSTNDRQMNATFRTASSHPSVPTTVSLAAYHDGLTAPYDGTELRKNMRYERPATVMVEKLPSEIIGYAQLKNFSAGGMMLLSDFAVHPGEFVKIRFDKPLHSSVPKTVESRVAWCQDLEDQNETVFRFGIGLRLM
jgi:hypothetical protein